MTERDTKGRGLDWVAAYERLERLADAATTDAQQSPEREREVMDERARRLAVATRADSAPAHLLELVHFHVGGQDYALEARFVREVLRSSEQHVTLPGAPPQLRGVVLLHGEVLAVVELAPLFGRPAPSAQGPILVVGLGRAELGLRADRVEEVLSVSREALLAPPGALGPQERSLVAGLTSEGIIVLEGEALLRDGRLFFDLSEERTS